MISLLIFNFFSFFFLYFQPGLDDARIGEIITETVYVLLLLFAQQTESVTSVLFFILLLPLGNIKFLLS